MQKDTEFVWHKDPDVSKYDCIVLPGGFSYGDYLRTGAIAQFSPVMDTVKKHADRGKLVIGICNGFQILLETGLLPGAMLRNRSLQFICKYVNLRVETVDSPFTCAMKDAVGATLVGARQATMKVAPTMLRIPIAHGEGNYFADEATLFELNKNHQVLVRYADEKGNVTPESNPNGSLENIAGICNLKRNVFGLMPHPERASEAELGSTDGKKIFESIIASLN